MLSTRIVFAMLCFKAPWALFFWRIVVHENYILDGNLLLEGSPLAEESGKVWVMIHRARSGDIDGFPKHLLEMRFDSQYVRTAVEKVVSLAPAVRHLMTVIVPFFPLSVCWSLQILRIFCLPPYFLAPLSLSAVLHRTSTLLCHEHIDRMLDRKRQLCE